MKKRRNNEVRSLDKSEFLLSEKKLDDNTKPKKKTK